jgi:putative ABC transport system permease protein
MLRAPLEAVWNDAGLSIRLLRRQPAFAAVALLTLALGIGASTAVFSVVHAVLIRPLPYPEADRIVRFRIEASSPGSSVVFDALPVTTALTWGARSTTLSAMALYNDRALTLSTPDGPFRLTGISATPNLFDLLGVAPMLGETFRDATTGRRDIVLSHTAWTRFFAADRLAIGSTATFDHEPYRIVAVMPASFGFPTPEAMFWVPLPIDPGGSRGMVLPAIGRMRPGATVEAMLQEGRDELGDAGDARISQRLGARTLQDQMVGGVQRLLWVLLAAVGFVLAIATVNVALLLLTRGAKREREFSMRLALGAARSRLVRQLFTEGLMLGALGGAAGLGLAWLGLATLRNLAPADIPRLREASLDGEVLVFALALTFATSVLFGVLSAGRTVAVDPVRALMGAGETPLSRSSAPSRRRLNALAAGALAMTMVLLVGAALLLRSFVGLVRVDQGYEPAGAIGLQVTLPQARYPGPAARLAFHDRLLERLAETSGVSVAGLAPTIPGRQPAGRFDFRAGGLPSDRDPFSMHVVDVHMVTEGFIEAMGLRVVAGRTFRSTDTPGAEPVMVISQSLARQEFAGRNPVGELLYSGTGNRRVVGVVADVRPVAPGAEIKPSALLPLRQNADILEWFSSVTVMARGANPRGLAAGVRALVLSLDPEMPPFNVRRLDEDVSRLVAGPRFSAFVLSVFAATAFLMAAIGVYGVMAYSTGLRTREIGVRIALGATRGDVRRLLLRDGAVVIVTGLVIGFVAAVWLAQSLTGLLHEVAPADPAVLLLVAAVLASAGLIAAFLPVRRATGSGALDALRQE